MKTTKDYLDEFKELYSCASPKLIYFACKYVDLETAEDIVQDIFIKLWNNIEEVDFNKNIMSYLFFGVKAASIDYLRQLDVHNKYLSYSLLQKELNDLTHYELQHLEEESEVLTQVKAEIDKLPDKCKEVMTLSYFRGLSNDQIALQLNISKRTVEAQLYKGLLKVRKNILLVLVSYLIIR